MTNVTHKFLSMYLFLFLTLHVTSTSCSSSGQTNCVNTTSGSCQSVSVAVSCAGRKFTPYDEYDVLETCRELKIKINTEKGICASRWSFTKNHYMMHDQQNIKYRTLELPSFLLHQWKQTTINKLYPFSMKSIFSTVLNWLFCFLSRPELSKSPTRNQHSFRIFQHSVTSSIHQNFIY